MLRMSFIYQKYLDEDLTERKLFYTEDIVPTENDEELTYESSVTPTVESFIYGTQKKLYINESKNKIPSQEDSNFAAMAGDVVVLGER